MIHTTSAPLQGKVALIAGGAGGIGRATAAMLAELGARCVIAGRRDPAELAAVCDTLPGGEHLPFSFDISDSRTIIAMREAILSRLGRTDILINTAGFTKVVAHADLDALNDDLIDRMFTVNWRGSFALIRAFAPALTASGNGFIANVSSIAATTGVGSNIAYCAVKAATDSLTMTVARVLAPEVRVVSISPGVVDTDFVPGRDDAWKRQQSDTAPMRKLVTAHDVADAIKAALLHLPVTTGSVIQVDSGRHL